MNRYHVVVLLLIAMIGVLLFACPAHAAPAQPVLDDDVVMPPIMMCPDGSTQPADLPCPLPPPAPQSSPAEPKIKLPECERR